MECYNLGYKISECCEAFNIPRSSLRDHLSGRTTTRKIGAKTILTNEEEALLIQYIDDMLEVGQPLTPEMLKLKVAEICQGKLIPFKDGIPGDSWFFWFKQRHPHLVMRKPQGLEVARAKAMNPITCHEFYKNLLQLYNKFAYPPSNIWNVDESGCNASKSGLDRVLARKGVRSVYAQIPNEREWLNILTSINVAGHSIPHFYIFKGKRRLRDYIHLCEAGSIMAMQEKEYMTSYLFSRWMDHFIEQLEAIGNLSPSNRHLVILDGHKSHVSLEVIQKAKHHGVDMISLPSHTSHALQPLDVACFKPFKTALKAYRNKWMVQNSGGKVEKDILAQWVDLSLKKALSPNNIRRGFRATGIWPLNLDKMEAKVGPSKPYNSLPSENVIVEDIMEEDIPSEETNGKHYYVEDDDDVEHEEGIGAKNAPPITDFLKLPQKQGQGTRILHEPLVDYSHSQVLTVDDHIQNMQEIAHKKSIVAMEKEERVQKMELTKTRRAAEKILKESAKIKKAKEKEQRASTLRKWKEDDNGGQRQKILDLIQEDNQYSRHISHGMTNTLPWQCKINQRSGKAKLLAKKIRRECGIPLPIFLPPLELPCSDGYVPPIEAAEIVQPLQRHRSVNWELQTPPIPWRSDISFFARPTWGFCPYGPRAEGLGFSPYALGRVGTTSLLCHPLEPPPPGSI